LKTNCDLDDKHRLCQKGHEREQVVAGNSDTSRWQEEDVGSDRRDHRRQQTRPAPPVPRRHDHRSGEKEKRMILAKAAEHVFDAERDGHCRDGDAVADQHAHITIHADVAGYRSPLAGVGSMKDRFPTGAARFDLV